MYAFKNNICQCNKSIEKVITSCQNIALKATNMPKASQHIVLVKTEK